MPKTEAMPGRACPGCLAPTRAAWLGRPGAAGRVKVWSAAQSGGGGGDGSGSGQCIQTLEGPGEAVEWVRWHPKGNVLLAGAADFTAWMWLAQTGACMQVRAYCKNILVRA
jgi:WD40 repeat protein